MPAAVTAVVALASGASIASVAFNLIGSLVLGAVSRKLAKRKGPKVTPLQTEATERRHIIRASTPPARVVYGRVLTSGALAHVEVLGEQNLVMVIALADHQCQAIGSIYLNEELLGSRDVDGVVTDGRWGKLDDGTIIARIQTELGTDDDLGFPLLQSVSSKWTKDHRGRGVCKMWLTFFWSRSLIDRGDVRSERGSEQWPTGIPNPAVVVDGRLLYDPRTGVTEWSDNPALAILDALQQPWGGSASLEDIDVDAFVAAADICDQEIEYRDKDGNTVTGKRYRTNGSFTLDREPRDILDSMASSCGATLYMGPGPISIQVASPRTTTRAALTVDDLTGDIRLRPRRALFSATNVVRGTWVDEKDLWRVKQFKSVRSATYQAQDDGLEISEELELPMTSQEYIARRVAKIELELARQEIQFDSPLKPRCLDIVEGDVVPWTVPDLGWSDKPFLATRTAVDQYGGIVVSWQEYADVFDLEPDQEFESDPAQDTQLETPIDPGPPGAPLIEESLYVARNGAGVRARVTLAWSAPTERDIASEYRVRWRPVGEKVWVSGPVVPDLEARLDDVPPGEYDFAVRGEALTGRTSPWATTRATIYALSARPAVPTSLGLSTFVGSATLTWDPAPDLDVEIGGSFVLRHSTLTSGATWASGVPLLRQIPGNATEVTVASMPGTYMLRAKDSTGQLSAGSASISTDAPSVIAWTAIASATEDPGFNGVKTVCSVAAGVLSVDVVGDFDSWSDVDAVASWDLETGAKAAASYVFANRIDLGAAQDARLVAALANDVTQELTDIDDRGLPVDEWLDWDGGVDGNEAEARLEFRRTNDDPAGSPTWSEWSRLSGTEVFARAFEFRVLIDTSDPAYRWETDSITVTAYGVT